MAFTPAAIGAYIAAAGVGYSVYSGEESAKAGRRGVRRQETAQKQAHSAAISQQRQSEMAANAANRKAPDIGAILANAQKGLTSPTMLSGIGGVDQSKLKLGRPSLLGE